MLIRSQHKGYLINMQINDIFLIGREVRASHPATTDTYTLLGTYDKADRAIEVLDDIERLYGSQEVYRMPER